MNWLAWVGVVIGALIVMYAVAMIWLGAGIAKDDFEDGGASVMQHYPQFDPDRPTAPAEDFNDLDQEALERFVAWLAEKPDTLEHIIDIHRDTRAVQSAVQAWSEEVKKERR